MTTAAAIIIACGIFSYLLTCWALLDVAGRDFGGIGPKALWGCVAFVPFIGWLVYLLIGLRRGVKPPGSAGA